MSPNVSHPDVILLSNPLAPRVKVRVGHMVSAYGLHALAARTLMYALTARARPTCSLRINCLDIANACPMRIPHIQRGLGKGRVRVRRVRVRAPGSGGASSVQAWRACFHSRALSTSREEGLG